MAGFTSGEEDMVETRIPVSERKRVTRRLTRPGTTCGVAIGKYWVGWMREKEGINGTTGNGRNSIQTFGDIKKEPQEDTTQRQLQS